MKIFLIRHGETTGDVEDRYGGSYDDHLTDNGRLQIEQTVDKLVGKDIETIFSSSLIRTKETTEIINSKLCCQIEILDGLRERHYGVLGGLTKNEALEKYSDAVELHKDPHNTDPEGESWKDFNERVIKTFESIIKQNYNTVAIISHGGPIKRILNHLNMELPDSIDDGGIIEVNVE